MTDVHECGLSGNSFYEHIKRCCKDLPVEVQRIEDMVRIHTKDFHIQFYQPSFAIGKIIFTHDNKRRLFDIEELANPIQRLIDKQTRNN